MANREDNTMAEFCNKFMKTIAEAKQMPDADMEFLQTLEDDIVSYLKPPSPDQQPQQGMGPVGAAMGSVMGGGGMATQMPNPDEFRRTVTSGQR